MAFNFQAMQAPLATIVNQAAVWPMLWGQQGKARPAPPFWGLKVGSYVPQGVAPYMNPTYDPTQPNGSEMGIQMESPHYLTIAFQAFALAGQGDPDPALTAMAVLKMLFELPKNVDALLAVGMGLIEVGTVINISAALETDYESRASLDVRFLVIDDATERDGYIATVIPPVGTITY